MQFNKLKRLLFILVLSSSLFGQAFRFDPSPATMISPNYQPGTIAPLLVLPNSAITLCGYPATGGTPCTNLATSYTDATASTACGSAIPVTPAKGGICTGYTDPSGNFGFWLQAGNYTYTITNNGTSYGPYAFSVGGGGSGGGIPQCAFDQIPFYNAAGVQLSCLTVGTGLTIQSGVMSTTSSGGGNATGVIYNQGSPSAVPRTVDSWLREMSWLDDFGCLPTNTPAANNAPCQQALNYAASRVTALHCSGTYQISVPLQPPAAGTGGTGETIIIGEGVSWVVNTPVSSPATCIIQQTNPSVAVFSYKGINYAPLTLKHVGLLGGTNSVELVANGTTGAVGGPMRFEDVYFEYYTHAGIYLDPWSAMQGLYTTGCRFQAGSNTANGVMMDALSASANPGINGFLTEWIANNDQFGGGQHGIILDSDGHSGGYQISNEHFQDMYGTPIVLKGGIATVSFHGIGNEATGAGDNGGSVTNPQWNDTTGTTTVANATAIQVATTVRMKVGDIIHITGGGGVHGQGDYGIDFDTTIASCSPNACGYDGTNTINTTTAIPNIVTNQRVTNSQSNLLEVNYSSVNTSLCPQWVSIYDSQGCIGNLDPTDAGSCRYSVYNPTFWGVAVYNMAQGQPNYDPTNSNGPNIGQSNVGTVTNQFSLTDNYVNPGLQSFNGNHNWPTVYSGNPGQGELHWACGSGTDYACSENGTFGSAYWMRNAPNKRPYFQINYDTGLVSVGPNYDCCTGIASNMAVGPATPQGATMSLDLFDGSAPTSHTGGVNGANQLVALSGVLWHYDPQGGAHNLDNPLPANKVVCSVDVVNQSASQSGTLIPCNPGPGAKVAEVNVWARVKTAATSASTLGSVSIYYVEGSTQSGVYQSLGCRSEGGNDVTSGNTENTVGASVSCVGTLYLQSYTNGLQFNVGYYSAGATTMVYDAHARVLIIDNIPTP